MEPCPSPTSLFLLTETPGVAQRPSTTSKLFLTETPNTLGASLEPYKLTSPPFTKTLALSSTVDMTPSKTRETPPPRSPPSPRGVDTTFKISTIVAITVATVAAVLVMALAISLTVGFFVGAKYRKSGRTEHKIEVFVATSEVHNVLTLEDMATYAEYNVIQSGSYDYPNDIVNVTERLAEVETKPNEAYGVRISTNFVSINNNTSTSSRSSNSNIDVCENTQNIHTSHSVTITPQS